jgi:hypothetical protein
MAIMRQRCPRCGYPVDGYFDHVDKTCDVDDAAEAERTGAPYYPPVGDDGQEPPAPTPNSIMG